MKNTRSTLSTFLIGFLIDCCVLTVGHADEITLNPTHPEKYTVVTGDTLWDISGKFLQHPWQWKKLWETNSQIKNPNLIYPNDTIYFSLVNGQPQLSLSRPQELRTDKPCVLKPSEYEKGRQSFLLDKNGKVLPCSRESELEQPINLIPHDQIATFLTSPKVVGEDEFKNSPYVIGFHEGHLIAGAGDKVYVRGLDDENLTEKYTLYRAGETYYNAETNEVLGHEAKYVANATLQTNGDPATLIITKGSLEIRTGDRIMPDIEVENTLNFFPRPPEQPLHGQIISVINGRSLIGLYSVVVIDKGSADGLITGHELMVYQRGKTIIDTYRDDAENVQLPDEMAGKIMIFRAFEHLSYALVMQVNHDIHRLDDVKTQ
ncbi:MAG: LysM peptidoglycan-binding domain-containing protein [Methylococcaceae bacterium]